MIPENIKQEIFELADTIAGHWYFDVLKDIEFLKINSPIEQLFYAAWRFMKYQDHIELIPQAEIEGYYVDFLLINHTKIKSIELAVVELDGHEWHEKTPEQVERDKKRERIIVSRGLPVFRFSGKEIKNDPTGSARQVFDSVLNLNHGVFDA